MQRSIFLIFSIFSLLGCSASVQRLNPIVSQISQQDPALSGDGRKLALISDQNGRPTVQLRETFNGKNLILKHLSSYRPHSSPSLSWSGRYLAVIAQIGNRRLVIIEDILKGNMHRITIPVRQTPVRVSLSPDATKIAIQISRRGKWNIIFFDITRIIEPDRTLGMNY